MKTCRWLQRHGSSELFPVLADLQQLGCVFENPDLKANAGIHNVLAFNRGEWIVAAGAGLTMASS